MTDVKGNTVNVGDHVICVSRSILLIPMCTSENERPSRNTRASLKYDYSQSRDENRRASFSATLNNCILHRDVILEKDDIAKGERLPVLEVTSISGDHATFKSEGMDIRHYHPLIKFLKLRKYGNNTQTKN